MTSPAAGSSDGLAGKNRPRTDGGCAILWGWAPPGISIGDRRSSQRSNSWPHEPRSVRCGCANMQGRREMRLVAIGRAGMTGQSGCISPRRRPTNVQPVSSSGRLRSTAGTFCAWSTRGESNRPARARPRSATDRARSATERSRAAASGRPASSCRSACCSARVAVSSKVRATRRMSSDVYPAPCRARRSSVRRSRGKTTVSRPDRAGTRTARPGRGPGRPSCRRSD